MPFQVQRINADSPSSDDIVEIQCIKRGREAVLLLIIGVVLDNVLDTAWNGGKVGLE